MIDMNKEVIFRNGMTLDGKPLTDYNRLCAFDLIKLGYQYGLRLNQFDIDDEMIYFEWCGTKKDASEWYTYVSINMIRESEEARNKILKIIYNK